VLISQGVHAEPTTLAIQVHAARVTVRLQAFHPSQGA
jgi:hypothetical protein